MRVFPDFAGSIRHVANYPLVNQQSLKRISIQCRLDRAFSADLDDVKRVGKFVSHFHPPILTRLQLAIQALQQLTRRHGCFFPCRMPVG